MFSLRKLPLFCKKSRKTGNISRWDDQFENEQWAGFILSEIKDALDRDHAGNIVLIGRGNLLREVEERLQKAISSVNIPRIFIKNSTDDRLLDLNIAPEHTIIVACAVSNSEVTEIFKVVMKNQRFKDSEFIFKIRPSNSYDILHDSRDPHDSPAKLPATSLLDNSLINDIYRYTLTKVEQKCQVKDAYDLYQMMLETKDVDGAIAEFGSYRGHSGLIIAEIARRLNINKTIYLCDTFKGFPDERYGIDRIWNNSNHDVDFEKVKTLFKDYKNVRLIRGDFAETIDAIHEEKFSLVYVDCDSYRATNLISEKVYPKLNRRGAIIYEDYGHSFCLGARYAVDEFYRHKKDCFRFFSFFSGMQVIVKL